ncbi:restriction endonuclease subunit S [Planococcus kocurii]|uniref:restriction endonuclease subunit S n=1 Tax=Planococcus kocurii TaxID=1374 RepID=UPI003D087B91
MKKYKLIELVSNVISGEWGEDATHKPSDVKVIRTTNFTNTGQLNLNKSLVYRHIDETKVLKKQLKSGDTIIEKSGGSPAQPVGRVVFFEETEDTYLCNNFTSILRPNTKVIEPKYLFYLLFNLYHQRKVMKFQNKTTGIINLKLEQYLNGTEVVISNKKIQCKIVEILDSTYLLINKRQSQIAALDELIQSVFLDMFGDIVQANKWNRMNFGDICETRLGKMLDKKRQDHLIQKYYLGNRHVQWGNFELDNLPQMGFSEQELEKFALKKGDLLICEGGEVGRCAIWQWDDRNIYFQKAIHRARVNKNLATAEYIQYVMFFFSQNNGFKDYTTTSTIAHLTGVKLNKLPIPLPPIELQDVFGEKIKEIEKQKLLLEKSLKKIQSLYNSLIHKAFQGELIQEE